jgi:hypothetical protein
VRARDIAVIMAALVLGCRPAPVAPKPAPAPASAEARVPDSEPGHDGAAAAPPAGDLPRTCAIELALLVPRATGHGASDTSFDAAKEAAWAQACADLRKSADLDCHDAERVSTVSEQSSSVVSSKSGVRQTHFEYDVVLGARRTAEGFGDAPDDRQEACRRAMAHACEQLVRGPCPETGVRVISVDGKPPNAAAVEPVPAVPQSRETI